jgi:hypothetical protein
LPPKIVLGYSDTVGTGGHDNGYLHTLTELQSERLLDKIVLLKGYKRVAAELQSLPLPTLEIESLFMPEKLSPGKWSNGHCNQYTPPVWTVKDSPATLSYSKVTSSGVEYFDKQRCSNMSVSTSGLRRPNPHLVSVRVRILILPSVFSLIIVRRNCIKVRLTTLVKWPYKSLTTNRLDIPPPCNLFYLAQYCINGVGLDVSRRWCD